MASNQAKAIACFKIVRRRDGNYRLPWGIFVVIERFFSGEADLSVTILVSLLTIVAWLVIGLYIGPVVGAFLPIQGKIWMHNTHAFSLGFATIYGASLIMQSALYNMTRLAWKIGSFALAFLLILIGMLIIIFVTSGELSWMIYVNEGLRVSS